MTIIKSNNFDAEVLCAFCSDNRFSFGVRVCDNLVDGVPVCILADFYPDVDPNDDVDGWLNGTEIGFERCKHFVFSDVYRPVAKHGCLFGGVKCVNSGIEDFCICVGCERWLKK